MTDLKPLPIPPLPAESPLDKLDPAMIPAAERYDGQPKELVAVLGQSRQRIGHTVTLLTVSK